MTDKKSDAKNESAKTTGLTISNFKPFEAPRRKAGLRDDQVSISNHSIAVPKAVADKLGEKVALLYSDADSAIAIQKNATGEYKLKQIGKLKSTKSVYCKTLIEAKKIGKGRYSTSFDEKNQMLIVGLK